MFCDRMLCRFSNYPRRFSGYSPRTLPLFRPFDPPRSIGYCYCYYAPSFLLRHYSPSLLRRYSPSHTHRPSPTPPRICNQLLHHRYELCTRLLHRKLGQSPGQCRWRTLENSHRSCHNAFSQSHQHGHMQQCYRWYCYHYTSQLFILQPTVEFFGFRMVRDSTVHWWISGLKSIVRPRESGPPSLQQIGRGPSSESKPKILAKQTES